MSIKDCQELMSLCRLYRAASELHRVSHRINDHQLCLDTIKRIHELRDILHLPVYEYLTVEDETHTLERFGLNIIMAKAQMS